MSDSINIDFEFDQFHLEGNENACSKDFVVLNLCRHAKQIQRKLKKVAYLLFLRSRLY